MKKGIPYRLALLLLGAVFMTGCAGAKENVTAENVESEMAQALPQAGEAAGVVEKEVVEDVETTVDETTESVVDEKKESSSKKTATKGTIQVATVGSPNTEILQQAAILSEEKGYQLKIEVCEDYLTPNQMLVEEKVDCNYYQHEAFLERYNIEHQTTLAEVAKIHYEPLAIYSQTMDSLEQMEKGMQVAISNNPTAIARALWLLQDAGLVKLVSDADMNTVKDDVTENPNKLEFVFVEESELAGKLQEADMVICSKDVLMQEAIDAEELILAEESKDTMMVEKLAQSVVAVEANNEKAKILAETLLSDEMKQYVDTKYQGSVVLMQETPITGDENAEKN